jgi:DNA gyrase subunit B
MTVATETRTYTSADIRVLEGIEAIRTRPGMYVGSTGSTGLHHLIWEAVDNATDEAIAGYGKNVWVEVDADGWATVRDEARGIPFDPKQVNGKKLPAATVILTVPHSGGKFDPGAYKTAGGLHGVGATIINALSEKLELTIWRDGKQFKQTFERGVPSKHVISKCDKKKTGTQLRWLFDREIFSDPAIGYQQEIIESRLRAAAYLNRGIAFHLSMWDDDAEEMVQQTFLSKNGLPDYIEELRPRDRDSVPVFKTPVNTSETRDGVLVEVAIQPNRGERTRIVSFANGVRTIEGGTHESGFQAALPLERGELARVRVEDGAAEVAGGRAVRPEGGQVRRVLEARRHGRALAVAEEDLDELQLERGGVKLGQLGGGVRRGGVEGRHGGIR